MVTISTDVGICASGCKDRKHLGRGRARNFGCENSEPQPGENVGEEELRHFNLLGPELAEMLHWWYFALDERFYDSC